MDTDKLIDALIERIAQETDVRERRLLAVSLARLATLQGIDRMASAAMTLQQRQAQRMAS
jgi:hypothetical protein